MQMPGALPDAYHVICRGNDRRAVFHSEDDHEDYLRIVEGVKKEMPFELFHYVLMTNHVHLVLRPSDYDSLPVIMQRINHRYALHHKRKYGNSGHLWRARYKRFVIANDNYLLTCGIYVELNPVRAGMVAAAPDYRWSSHEAYRADGTRPLITPSPAFLALAETDAERRYAYHDIVNMWLTYPVGKRRAKKFFKAHAPTRYP